MSLRCFIWVLNLGPSLFPLLFSFLRETGGFRAQPLVPSDSLKPAEVVTTASRPSTHQLGDTDLLHQNKWTDGSQRAAFSAALSGWDEAGFLLFFFLKINKNILQNKMRDLFWKYEILSDWRESKKPIKEEAQDKSSENHFKISWFVQTEWWGLDHTDRFAAESEAARMRISTSKCEAVALSRRVQCPELLPQVE